MVVLPKEYVMIKYPGYYWNTKLLKLFSLKNGGILKEMKLRPLYKDRYIVRPPCYQISHNGERHYIAQETLVNKYKPKPSHVHEVIGERKLDE